MISVNLTFNNFEGNEITDTFYFNLSKAELAEMDINVGNALANNLQELSESSNGAKIYKVFKDIIMKSYLEKSEDGKHIIKNKEISSSFVASEAYSALIEKVLSSQEEASKFMLGIVSGWYKPTDVKNTNS